MAEKVTEVQRLLALLIFEGDRNYACKRSQHRFDWLGLNQHLSLDQLPLEGPGACVGYGAWQDLGYVPAPQASDGV